MRQCSVTTIVGLDLNNLVAILDFNRYFIGRRTCIPIAIAHCFQPPITSSICRRTTVAHGRSPTANSIARVNRFRLRTLIGRSEPSAIRL